MKILISGSSGFIGSALIAKLGHPPNQIVRLVRRAGQATDTAIPWDPYKRIVDSLQLEGFDAVIHLAGRSIAGGRWTESVRKEVGESRIQPTRSLAETLADLKHPPRTFVCASAIGYYGNRGEEILTESSAPGEGFLPELCTEWEQACDPVRAGGIRTINLRIGIVLASHGGALGRMLLPFKLGLGGQFGAGRQYMSWVTLTELVSIFEFVLTHDSISGPVNGVSPEPLTNKEFTKTLGRVLRRPTYLAIPAFAVKLLLGEMGDSLLLSSARVVPDKLRQAGYRFEDTKLELALHRLLDQPGR